MHSCLIILLVDWIYPEHQCKEQANRKYVGPINAQALLQDGPLDLVALVGFFHRDSPFVTPQGQPFAVNNYGRRHQAAEHFGLPYALLQDLRLRHNQPRAQSPLGDATNVNKPLVQGST